MWWIWLIVVVAVLAVAGFAAMVVLFVAVQLARRPDRAPVERVEGSGLDGYFDSRASFAVTVRARPSLTPEQVWSRLCGSYMSTLPFLSGPEWVGEPAVQGAVRTMSGTVYSVTEQVVGAVPNTCLELSGIAVCAPWTIRDFAERFVIEQDDDGVVVSWTIGGSPRWVGFLPWRWGAPLTCPFFAFVLRHALRPRTFRRS